MMTIDWTKPLETVAGIPAKFVGAAPDGNYEVTIGPERMVYVYTVEGIDRHSGMPDVRNLVLRNWAACCFESGMLSSRSTYHEAVKTAVLWLTAAPHQIYHIVEVKESTYQQ